MALVTTAGAADADSYAALADTDAYFLARGVTAWTGTDAAKENYLRRATTYLDNQYRNRWIGVRVNQTQSLAWPRCNAESIRTTVSITMALIDDDGFEIATDTVPLQIQRATMEAALLLLGGTVLEPSLERGGRIQSISKGVGPLSKSITYENGASAVDRYTVIEGLLRGLTKSTPGSSNGTVELVRA